MEKGRIRELRAVREKIDAEIGILNGDANPEPQGYGTEVCGTQATNMCCGQMGRDKTPEEIIDDLFTYQDARHSPNPDLTLSKYAIVRDAAKHLALQIWKACPYGRDRTRAIDTLRDAVAIANASIALDGKEL